MVDWLSGYKVMVIMVEEIKLFNGCGNMIYVLFLFID